MSLVLIGKRTQAEAAELLDLSVRQVRRLQRRLEMEKDSGVVHKLRGRPSNRRLDDAVRAQALEIYQREYPGFGPTMAAEKLSREHDLKIGAETLRLWLIKEGLCKRQRQRERHRSRRERRNCFGQMLQADASNHDWLEGRCQTPLRLVGIIDDATSFVMLRFYPGETTEAYMDLLRRWIQKHGRPISWYCDQHGVFVARDELGNRTATQFSRALEELDIELIAANSPQAKGRIERVWGTAQDRLVKELRLARAGDIDSANAVLEEKFTPWFNRNCVVKPASGNDAHRSLGRLDLAAIFSIQAKRVVGNDYTIHLDGRVYQLLKPVWPGERGGEVVVEKRLDGSMKLRFKDKYLEYRPCAEAGPRVCEPGALPPDPRSLAQELIPAEGREQATAVVDKGEGRAGSDPARPSAGIQPGGRSGCTPAEPCPAAGGSCGRGKSGWRPASNHPWRGKHSDKADSSTLAK